jgi:hypothetical protein
MRSEILGRNPRFLNFRGEQPGADLQEHRQSKLNWANQTILTQYKKGGQAFRNVVTVIPISWDGHQYRFCVTFMLDLAEHPECIMNALQDKTYRINYLPTQPPRTTSDSVTRVSVNAFRQSQPDLMNNPISRANQPTDIARDHAPAEQTKFLPMTSLEADPPWFERDGLPNPYALPLGVFHHTSRMNLDRDMTPKPASNPQDKASAEQEQTKFLSMTSPEADSPWSERDRLPPPYALSPEVFYHTSRMGLLSL